MHETYTYRFLFEELFITRPQLERVMGYEPGTIPEPFPEIIDSVLSVAGNFCDIHGGYVIFDNVLFDTKDRLLYLGQTTFDIRNIVFQQVKNSRKLAIFVFTAGAGIGEWSKQLMAEGDLMKGYVVDVVGSEVVELAMDKMQAALAQQMAETGLLITNRYSPGYCGWIVAEQHKLFSLLPENFCGVTLSDTALMYPIKSVSGIIGIGESVKFNSYTCRICDAQNCLYRNKKS